MILLILAGCANASAEDKTTPIEQQPISQGAPDNSPTPIVISEQSISDLPPQKLLISDITLKLLSTNSPIWPGEDLKITVQTEPYYWCEVAVSNGGNPFTIPTRFQADEKGLITAIYKYSSSDMPGYKRLIVRAGKDLNKNPPINNSGMVTAPTVAPGQTPVKIYPVEAELISSFFVN